ncbi:TlpA family protein disulfide reductase [Usitatibacter palustris]|uniref:Thiol-disulfide oxidoreductase ResA n=1 Tax=Usitatibacter palustris TaxID=2732487 RepID=A0A6M4HBF5_9PROT|nr:TlpA disulfide reductase family protein [Usitatibacter palustris]QJR15963.1 Thiol-disulfide oxidoreductase ResA [Usitatibacter palustris]
MKTNRLSGVLGLWSLVLGLACALPAAAFDLTDTTGQHHRLADYKGRWVVVNFWATWCTPCIAEIPEIAQFAKDRAKDVVVIGVALDVEDSEEKTKQFAKKVGHAYPLVLGDDAVEKQLGKVRGLPTTRVYDPTGKRVYDQLGPVTKKSLEESTTPPTTKRS